VVLAHRNSTPNDYLAAMCEAIAEGMPTRDQRVLAEICSQVNCKVTYSESSVDSYVSTESLLPDKAGRRTASSLPSAGRVTVYRRGDTLVSNIRPYFKKVWFADRDGTCSADVIAFRARNARLAPYLYAILRNDAFFEHVMAGAKGTKMPRGDKTQIMHYPVASEYSDDDLAALASLVDQISANNNENVLLEKVRDTLLPKLMSGEIDVSEVELPMQPNNHLSAD